MSNEHDNPTFLRAVDEQAAPAVDGRFISPPPIKPEQPNAIPAGQSQDILCYVKLPAPPPAHPSQLPQLHTPADRDASPPRSSSLDPSNQTGNTHNTIDSQELNGLILPDQWIPPIDFEERPGPAPIEPVTICEAAWRHSGWRHQRLQVWRALQRVGVNNHRLLRFANCGAACYVEVLDQPTPDNPQGFDARLRSDTCHDRFCVPCGTAKAAAITAALTEKMALEKTRFITLTLRSNGKPLRDRLDRLYHCFGQLRHRQFWKDHVDGGAAFCEAKIGKDPTNWHVHLHIIVTGSYIPQKDLSSEWHSVTGDSYIVDVRPVDEGHTPAAYITKYVTKPATKEVYEQPQVLDEMIRAFSGRRLCLTFGTWRGTPLKPKAPPTTGWRIIARLDYFAERNRKLTPIQKRALFVLARRYPERFQTEDQPPPQEPAFAPPA